MALQNPIFREYVGSQSHPDNLPDFPPDIINPEIKELHFIIAFASEKYDAHSGKGTGEFQKNWIVPNIDGRMIQQLKNKHKNVKVVISIGGRGPNYPFNPDRKEEWPGTASSSLTDFIKDLKRQGAGTNVIDGIDINYDYIYPDENVFATCIGSLIQTLKNNLDLVISIAPSYSVRSYYGTLFRDFKDHIDWVNFQFYTHTIPSKEEFKNLYRQLAKDPYTGHKLLAGFSTDPKDAGNLPLEVFIEACRDLIHNKELPGIFVWNANDSASQEPPFQVEHKAQNLLTAR